MKLKRKTIEFCLNDIAEINNIFGIRGSVRIIADVVMDHDKFWIESPKSYFKSSFTEDEIDADYAFKMLEEVLIQRGIDSKYLFSLSEGEIHNLL